MTWESNSTTWARCDDLRHEGDPRVMVQTAYTISARTAMKAQGWGYHHEYQHHVCPACVTRNIEHPKGVVHPWTPSSN